MVFIFSKKDLATRFALKNKFFFKNFGKFSDRKYEFESTCCKVLSL